MKYLIVGLGNMHPDYDDTRHNAGFDVVDLMAEKAGATWKLNNLGAITEIKHRGRNLILLKPSTYMNRSGKSLRFWMDKEKVPLERVLVVVDDINLDFGKIRLRGKGSDGGHNGLKDIQDTLGTNNYPRLRIGIGNDFYKGQQIDYVLGQWSDKERATLPEILEKAGEACKSFCAIGIGHTMTKFNG